MNIDTLRKGIEIILPEEGFNKRVENAAKNKKPLNIKLGFDPTAPDLHLGHFVVLKKLRDFQKEGHNIFVIVGDFTAQIGDPTGKNKTRPPLEEKQIKINAKTYIDQLSKVVDIKKIKVKRNSTWLGKMDLKKTLKLLASYNLGRMMTREDFSKRFKDETPIAMHELVYPLLQGYDSLMINADIEIGGTDQLFNMQVGRFLQENEGKEAQIVICMPLLRGLDGEKKMSKSLGNYIGISEKPNDMFGKIMSIPDSLLEEYLDLVTDFTEEERSGLKADIKNGKAMEVKKKIGKNIVKQFHSEKDSESAEKYFIDTFSKKTIPDDIQVISGNNKDLCSILISNNFVPSKSEFRRLLEQKGIKINGEIVQDQNYILKSGDIVQKGKLTFFKIK
jgi:tyrosyl-tRNA synthetase